MKNRSLLTLIFTLLSILFFLLLIFFRTPFPPYPLMSYQDAFDLLTPVVLIPVYWILFENTAGGAFKRGETLAFMVLSSVWVLGQGMHLAANSVNNLAEALAREQVFDMTGTTIYTLTYFFDEHLSHTLWHIGIAGLAALLIYRDWRHPSGEKATWWVTLLSGFLYGFTLFCIFLEGQTVLLGLPFTILITVLTLVWGRQGLAQRPVHAFFFVACLVAVLLFTGWGLYWGGFPEFSDVGLI
jgi:uncharacterized membrane protein